MPDIIGNVQPVLMTDSQGNAYSGGSVPTASKQYSTVSTATPVTADGTVFTLAAGEKGFIQNLNTTACYVKLGASASNTSFNFVLKACTATDDGLGGIIVIDDYVGVVSIDGVTSTRVSAFKLS
jgi:hypothetical protein